MTPVESAQIAELIKEVRGLRQDVREIHIKLFGEADSETPQGRLPRLEAKVAGHDRKLMRWEPVQILLRAAWTLVVAAFGYLAHRLLSYGGH